MYRLITVARTTGYVGELKVEKGRIGSDGTAYDSKTIDFTVVTDRDYLSAKRDAEGKMIVVNGKIEKERKPDYMYCQARDHVAQIMNDWAKTVRTDVQQVAGKPKKYVSRLVELAGHIETYTQKRHVIITQIVDYTDKTTGVTKKVNVSLNDDIDELKFKFVVKEVKFLDKGPDALSLIKPATSDPVGNTMSDVEEGTPTNVTKLSETVKKDSDVINLGNINNPVDIDSLSKAPIDTKVVPF